MRIVALLIPAYRGNKRGNKRGNLWNASSTFAIFSVTYVVNMKDTLPPNTYSETAVYGELFLLPVIKPPNTYNDYGFRTVF